MTCLGQKPDRPLTIRETKTLKRLAIRITTADLKSLTRFYQRKLKDHDKEAEKQLLKTRKQKLTTLARNLPEQLELACKWGKRHPLPKPPSPPPKDWQAIQQKLYPGSPVLDSISELSVNMEEDIRRFARSRRPEADT